MISTSNHPSHLTSKSQRSFSTPAPNNASSSATTSTSSSGLITSTFHIPPHEIQPRARPDSQGRANPFVNDICKTIMAKYGVTIELSVGKRTGVYTFLIRGKEDLVEKARREVGSKLYGTVSIIYSI